MRGWIETCRINQVGSDEGIHKAKKWGERQHSYCDLCIFV